MQPGAKLRLGMLHVLRGVAMHRLRVGAHREQAMVAAVGIDAVRGTLLPHIGCNAAEGLRLSQGQLQLAGLTSWRLWCNGDHGLAAGNGNRNAGLVLLTSRSSQHRILMRILLLQVAHGVGLSHEGARFLRGRGQLQQGTLCAQRGLVGVVATRVLVILLLLLLLEVVEHHRGVHRRIAGTVTVLDAKWLHRRRRFLAIRLLGDHHLRGAARSGRAVALLLVVVQIQHALAMMTLGCRHPGTVDNALRGGNCNRKGEGLGRVLGHSKKELRPKR